MSITPDITTEDLAEELEEFDFSPVPAGNYTLEVGARKEPATGASIELRHGKESGNPYLAVMFKHTGEFANRGVVWANIMVSGESATYSSNISGLVRALGLDAVPTIETIDENFSTLAVNGDNLSLEGWKVRASIGTETYEGKTKNVIKAFLPSTGE